MVKAVALLSGGLDSRLAVKLLLEQGIAVEAINFVTPFCTCTSKGSCRLEARKASEEFGIPLKVFYVFEEFIEVIKAPKFGYGKNLNPCLDCRILMFKKARQYMQEKKASFLISGEVLGERPMSQRLAAMRIIERESGLEGLILRPLSAKCLEPTIPEKEGYVDRQKLLDFKGRSRRPQMNLAEKLGLSDYPCPAGGCLLTNSDFAARLRRLLQIKPSPKRNDIFLLKVGRHFTSSDHVQIVVGRNERENHLIKSFAKEGDWLVEAADWLGPLTIIRGKEVTATDREKAALLTARYGKGKEQPQVRVNCWRYGQSEKEEILVERPLERAGG